MLGGRKVRIDRPRVRSKKDGDLVLPSYDEARRGDLLDVAVLERVLAGAATRSYPRTLDPIGEQVEEYATSRSAVSRRIVRGTRRALDEMMGRRLEDLRIVAMGVDGILVAEHTVVVAVGVEQTGRKHVLGLWEGTTENATVVKALFANLVERGLDLSAGCLFVLDGGKALKKAAVDYFGESALIQRCRIHKLRNVTDHLPHRERLWVERKFREALDEPKTETARAVLENLARSLDGEHPGAAASLREGLDDLLTVKRLGLPAILERSLTSTNIAESAISRSRAVTRRIKRWRGGGMILRWSATAMAEASRGFKKIRGHRELPFLVAALAKRKEVASRSKVA